MNDCNDYYQFFLTLKTEFVGLTYESSDIIGSAFGSVKLSLVLSQLYFTFKTNFSWNTAWPTVIQNGQVIGQYTYFMVKSPFIYTKSQNGVWYGMTNKVLSAF